MVKKLFYLFFLFHPVYLTCPYSFSHCPFLDRQCRQVTITSTVSSVFILFSHRQGGGEDLFSSRSFSAIQYGDSDPAPYHLKLFVNFVEPIGFYVRWGNLGNSNVEVHINNCIINLAVFIWCIYFSKPPQPWKSIETSWLWVPQGLHGWNRDISHWVFPSMVLHISSTSFHKYTTHVL